MQQLQAKHARTYCPCLQAGNEGVLGVKAVKTTAKQGSRRIAVALHPVFDDGEGGAASLQRQGCSSAGCALLGSLLPSYLHWLLQW